MDKLIKLFTNESFLGVTALTLLGCLAIWKNHLEIAGVAIGGIAAMLRGALGESNDA